MIEIVFSVKGTPPNNKNNKSMWGVESQIESIIHLRMSALIALNEAGFSDPFNSHVYISLTINAPEDRIEKNIDLDNLISGVCDALQPKPGNPDIKVHERFNNPDFADIHPDKPILFYNDNQIYGIEATKSKEETSCYTVTLRTEPKESSGELTHNEITLWSNLYNKDHPWWTSEENRSENRFEETRSSGLTH